MTIADHSGSFAEIRSRIKNSAGVRYVDFLSTLKPDYRLTWIHLAGGYSALVFVATAEFVVQRQWPWAGWGLVPLCAMLFGYFIHYVGQFFHEGAHYNLSADRPLNDLLANIFVGVLFGQHIAPNRLLHFEHHRHLGTMRDVENSYFDPLNMKFIVHSLLGFRTFRMMRQRGQRLGDSTSRSPALQNSKWMFLSGAAFHACVVLGVWSFGAWWLSISWTLGVLSVFPFLAALRTILEHRDDCADPQKNYWREPHGAFTRVFGDGLISSTLGGAGFNRHLLHHWEPQLPYTRLREVENFLMDTELAPVLRARKASYPSVFWRMLLAGM